MLCFISLKVPAEDIAGPEGTRKIAPWLKKMHKIVGRIEAKTYYDGYKLALGYATLSTAMLEEPMPMLFESTMIKQMSLANRFVRSATWEGMAGGDGSCTPKLVELMAQLAEGGPGLIISSHTYVSQEGQAGPWQLGIYDDKLVAGFSEMTRAVHKASGRIVMQLAHAGILANPSLTGQQPKGPSAFDKVPAGLAMNDEEIRKVIEAFAQAARRAQTAGFDGVQIHGAHGFLLSQFLSPFFNKRRDQYGGSIENRARLVLDVYHRVRSKVGDHFPVMIKLNSEDFLEGGLSLEEMVQVAAMLETAGIDAIELSGGTLYSGECTPVRQGKFSSEEEEAYHLEGARKYKERIGAPLMLVGGIRSYGVAERLVREGLADYISLSRPFIREPHLINRWKSGDTRRAKCQSDNLCFDPAVQGEGIYCVVERRLAAKKNF
jgi:2,4-dienoyl-CoA reductase-like NADH-dependent reductase (Old Yellow Enzyme family)